MKRALTAVLIGLLMTTACTSNHPLPRDPGKVVLPEPKLAVAGRLYATKHRSLYQFSGTRVSRLLPQLQLKDPAVAADGSRLAVAQLQGQSSTIVIGDSVGENLQAITPSSVAEGRLWAFMPSFSSDGRQIAFVSDRGKLRSSPQNLQPNDLGLWVYDTAGRQATRLVTPAAYTGGDSDPGYRPKASNQLIYTTYLYGGRPLAPVARLSWLSTQTGLRVFLSPDGARNFQPAVSPDGRFLAFVHADAGRDDLYVMPLAASYARDPQPYPTDAALLLHSGIVAQPVWAPDGSAIAFLMLVNGSFDLFVLPLAVGSSIQATGPARAITHASFLDADSRLAWSS